MMVTQSQIIKGVSNYFEAEICQKASGLMQFGAYFMLPSISARVQAALTDPKVIPMLSDVINADGLYNLDEIKDRAAKAMKHCGRLEFYGLILNSEDVDLLYDYIKRA